MPSQRRIKVFGLLVLLFVLITVYFTSSARQTRQSDFYTKTSNALLLKEEEAAKAAKAAQDAADRKLNSDDNEDVGKRLKEAEDAAKKSADEKGRKLAQEVMGAGVVDDDKTDGTRSVAGRYKMKDGKDNGDTPGVAKVGGGVGEKERKGELPEETEEEHEVEVELNAILKKSPIIIFSKTYCRFSKKAKHILLDVYNITPAPYVVELDIHPLGSGLQAALASKTKRRTVPNILINGFSIGGGDDIEDLHVNGKLEETVRKMGGKRITEVLLADEKGEMKRDTRRRKNKI